jgi:hypothetical protein
MSFRCLFLLSLSVLCACTGARSTKEAVPNVEGMQLSIVAGEQVYVEVTVQANMIVAIKKVANIVHPQSTMTFNLMKDESMKSMVLSVKNPLSRPVKYHIDIVDYRDGLHNTSSCPVRAGLSVFEGWPHPIPELRITNFHFLSAQEERTGCIY